MLIASLDEMQCHPGSRWISRLSAAFLMIPRQAFRLSRLALLKAQVSLEPLAKVKRRLTLHYGPIIGKGDPNDRLLPDVRPKPTVACSRRKTGPVMAVRPVTLC